MSTNLIFVTISDKNLKEHGFLHLKSPREGKNLMLYSSRPSSLSSVDTNKIPGVSLVSKNPRDYLVLLGKLQLDIRVCIFNCQIEAHSIICINEFIFISVFVFVHIYVTIVADLCVNVYPFVVVYL